MSETNINDLYGENAETEKSATDNSWQGGSGSDDNSWQGGSGSDDNNWQGGSGYGDSGYFDTPQSIGTEKKTDRKCPSCSGTMEYDPATGGMLCPYCGHTEAIEVTHGTKNDTAVAEQDFWSATNTESYDWGAEKRTVTCKMCGAVLVYDALQNSDVCPYCGSNQVIVNDDDKTMRPGGVVPFQITDKQAAELFYNWIKKKWFCPSVAKKTAQAGKFSGIYLPYWTFDTNTYSTYTGQYGREYTETRRVGDHDETHTEVRWYPTSGVYTTFIDDFPVLASKTHDSKMLSKLLPFRTEENKAYEPEFVAGFVSEKYSIGLKEGWEIAIPQINNIIKSGIEDQISSEYHTTHVRFVQFKAQYNDLKYKYLLLPIWNSSYKYKDKNYNFMVNGQTGKVAGKSPVSPLRVAVAVLAGILALVLIWYIFIGRNNHSSRYASRSYSQENTYNDSNYNNYIYNYDDDFELDSDDWDDDYDLDSGDWDDDYDLNSDDWDDDYDLNSYDYDYDLNSYDMYGEE